MNDEQIDGTEAGGDATAHAPRKGGALKKLAMIGVAVLLAGGGAAYWMLGGTKAEAAADPAVKIAERGVVPFETFLVNLSDPGGNRFLKVTLSLVVSSAEDAKHVEENASLMSHVRSAILELLTEQQAQALITAPGKQTLKDAITKRAADLLKDQKVLDVLFSEFVVQF
jgi:flagellar FliL protein